MSIVERLEEQLKSAPVDADETDEVYLFVDDARALLALVTAGELLVTAYEERRAHPTSAIAAANYRSAYKVFRAALAAVVQGGA